MSGDEWTESKDRLTYLWTQYRYRHELCWQAIYKITVAVIGLGVVPYIVKYYVENDALIKSVRSWLVVPPVFAMGLAAFGIAVINNELRLFAATKLAHHRLEDQLLGKLFQPLYEQITAGKARWTLFDHYAHTILIVLFLLSIGNAVFVWNWWIPSLAANTHAQSVAGFWAVNVVLIFFVIALSYTVWLLSQGTLELRVRKVRDSVTVFMSRIKTQLMRKASSNTPVSEFSVQELIRDWYRKLDAHPPVEEMLPFVADEGLVMKMPEETFYGHSGFKEWYYGVDQFRNQSHTVKALKIESNHDRATVNVITRWERSDSDASNPEASLAFYAAQTWTVERAPKTEKLRILEYNVDYFLEEFLLTKAMEVEHK